MDELYWIGRIGSLSTTANILVIIFLFALFVFIIGYLIEDDSETLSFFSKWIKRCVIGLIISAVIFIFTPSTKELYAIYGVGAVIDYVQNNETAKGLPDKAVKAIDKYLDEVNKDN